MYTSMNGNKKPTLSLIMPVYNSFSLARSDGENLLPVALRSLLRQTYRDFELVILDNQSTDDTQKICREFAAQNVCIRFVVDEQRRFAEAAIGKLAGLARGEYCMVVNDDDLWGQTYLEDVMRYMRYAHDHPDVDLVYGSLITIDVQNTITGVAHQSADEVYDEHAPRLFNVTRYIDKRNVIPLFFGVYKTEVFRAVLPYEDFDTLKANVDNVFMTKFFVLGYKAHYLPQTFFCYRYKNRKLHPPSFAPDMPSLDKPHALWFFYVEHQLLFAQKLMDLIGRKPFPETEMRFLRNVVMISCIQWSFKLLEWLKSELHVQNRLSELKVDDLLRIYQKGGLAEDLASYPPPEAFVVSDGTVSSAHVDWWQRKTSRTVPMFLELLQYTFEQERTNDSEVFWIQIKNKLEAEMAYERSLHIDLAQESLVTVPSRTSFWRTMRTFAKTNVSKWFPGHKVVVRAMRNFRQWWLRLRYRSVIRYAFEK